MHISTKYSRPSLFLPATAWINIFNSGTALLNTMDNQAIAFSSFTLKSWNRRRSGDRHFLKRSQETALSARVVIYQVNLPIEFQCAKSKEHRSKQNEYPGVDEPDHPYVLVEFPRDHLRDPLNIWYLYGVFYKIISEEPLSTMLIINLLRQICYSMFLRWLLILMLVIFLILITFIALKT